MPIENDNYSPTSNGESKDTETGSDSIFRYRAVKHYLEGKEQEVLPRFISPRSFFVLWIVFMLLLGSVVVSAYLVQLPIYASGPAIVVEGKGADKGRIVVAFLPPSHLEDLQEGSELLLRLGPEDERISREVTDIETEVLSPSKANERFDLQDAERTSIEGPAAVAMAPVGNLPGELSRSSYEGGVYQAEVEVDTQRVISLVR